MHLLTLYLLFLVVFSFIDFLFIIFVLDKYRAFIGKLFRISSLKKMVIYWLPAAISYLLMALLPVLFIFRYATNETSNMFFLLEGALVGGIIYGIYDMTNWAVVKDWKPSTVIADISWGIFLFAISTLIVGMIGKHFALFA